MARKKRSLRVEDELWEEFGEVCNDLGTSKAAEVRKFMREFIKKHKLVDKLEEIDELADQGDTDQIKNIARNMIKELKN